MFTQVNFFDKVFRKYTSKYFHKTSFSELRKAVFSRHYTTVAGEIKAIAKSKKSITRLRFDQFSFAELLKIKPERVHHPFSQ
jgi:hypothetical protein